MSTKKEKEKKCHHYSHYHLQWPLVCEGITGHKRHGQRRESGAVVGVESGTLLLNRWLPASHSAALSTLPIFPTLRGVVPEDPRSVASQPRCE